MLWPIQACHRVRIRIFLLLTHYEPVSGQAGGECRTSWYVWRIKDSASAPLLVPESSSPPLLLRCCCRYPGDTAVAVSAVMPIELV